MLSLEMAIELCGPPYISHNQVPNLKAYMLWYMDIEKYSLYTLFSTAFYETLLICYY